MNNGIVNINNNELESIELNCSELPLETNLNDCIKLPIGEIGALSIPIMEALTAVSSAGGSGLYMVNTSGGVLSWSAAKNAFIGGMRTASGELAQASLTPVVFNPMTLGTTLVMMSAMMKLNEINENTIKIINKLERKDKATILSAFNKLNEMVEGYKYAGDKESYMKNNLQTVNNYISELEKLHIEYKDELLEMSNKTSTEWSAKKYVNEVVYKYNVYQMTLYVISMANYIQAIFNKDYNEAYLNLIKERLERLNAEQKEIYTGCYDGIEKKYGIAISKKLTDAGVFILNGITNAPFIHFGFLGGIIELVTKLGAGKGHEKLKEHKEIDEIKTKSAIKQIDYSAVIEFRDKIDNINLMYNKPFNMILDKEYVYLKR